MRVMVVVIAIVGVVVVVLGVGSSFTNSCNNYIIGIVTLPHYRTHLFGAILLGPAVRCVAIVGVVAVRIVEYPVVVAVVAEVSIANVLEHPHFSALAVCSGAARL